MTTSATAGDWPSFRGPQNNGIALEDQAPVQWGPDQNIRWRTPLPGPGNSSPIVSRGRVFLTCAEEKGTKRNLYCFDRANGEMVWTRTVEYPVIEPTHHSNPYCASSPVADGSRVVVWHGSAGVFCYDYDGNEIWRRDLGVTRHDWGWASSPVIHHGKVFLNFGPGARTFLVALDLLSGDVLWKFEEAGGRDDTGERMIGSWTTPIVVAVDGNDQVVCSMPTRVIACDADSGALRWTCEGLSDKKADLVYASPLVCGDILVVFTGWVGGPTLGIKLGGSGDVTEANRLWREEQPQRIGSGVVVDRFVYIVNAGPGTAQCMECATGKVLWTERLEGGESWGSIAMAAGQMYVTSRRGVTTVFRAYPEKLEVLAMNDLGEASNTTPALSDGEIFLRTDNALYCVAED